VSGMDAGQVLQITVPPSPAGRFRVRFRVVERLHPIVRSDSVATIQTDGLLGNKYLQVDAGTEEAPPAPPGSTIPTREPFDWADLMEQLSGSLKLVNDTILLVRDDVIETAQWANQAMKQIDSIIKEARPDVRAVAASSRRISNNIDTILAAINKGEGTLGGLVRDRTLYDQASKTVGQIQQSSENLRKTTADLQSIIGRAKEEQVVEEITKTIANVRVISDRLRTAVDRFQAEGGTGGAANDLRKP
jgi:phospholipid/cholesterol/gamma-HCH transport system substrate-binding protein